ncbi:hypothetical protein WKI71_39940 [Streptomyces sp. MS1.AVA.1]|uniref:Uncharacterized protein n=1 Tax=Streptomyces machairae TaxID=3134109 RepID=A0ABU8UTS0_9ACTN
MPADLTAAPSKVGTTGSYADTGDALGISGATTAPPLTIVVSSEVPPSGRGCRGRPSCWTGPGRTGPWCWAGGHARRGGASGSRRRRADPRRAGRPGPRPPAHRSPPAMPEDGAAEATGATTVTTETAFPARTYCCPSPTPSDPHPAPPP